MSTKTIILSSTRSLRLGHSCSPITPQSYGNSPPSISRIAGVIPLTPLNTTFIAILDEKTRSECLKELSNPQTFLSDVTINAFGVGFKMVHRIGNFIRSKYNL